ncbi:MAG: carboxymuconolactone decarboxylase family protein [Steroidobacteraceae bacterium]|jgi:4-carboxymuconolactone decarboxylase|nr:carboxymuconolactone decarboxylase family protein [Steroidobacteraceae bacterium]
MTEKDAHETLRGKGRADMREIFGTEFMARRDATTNAFNAPLRALSEEFAYATLWSRPGLGRRERSLMTLAMLCALNRPHEIRLHVRAALNNGVKVEEIAEALTHAAAYCGLPAAIDALAVAEQVLGEMGRLPPHAPVGTANTPTA